MRDDDEHEETQRRMDALIQRSVAGLQAAAEDRTAVIAVIRPFLDEGIEIAGSPSALWEYFDTVLRDAGFDEKQRDWRFRVFSTVTQEVFMDGRPYPPNWPWHEVEPT